jgi:hypothetical protein
MGFGMRAWLNLHQCSTSVSRGFLDLSICLTCCFEAIARFGGEFACQQSIVLK